MPLNHNTFDNPTPEPRKDAAWSYEDRQTTLGILAQHGHFPDASVWEGVRDDKPLHRHKRRPPCEHVDCGQKASLACKCFDCGCTHFFCWGCHEATREQARLLTYLNQAMS